MREGAAARARLPRARATRGTAQARGPDCASHLCVLCFDPHDNTARPRVFIENSFICDTVPLDRVANASRRRRCVRGEAAPDAEPSGLDPLALIEAEHYDRVRPVGQPPTTKKTEKKEE